MNQVSENRMKLRVIYTRENPNEIFSDNIARYADWLETKLALFTEQLLQHSVMQAEGSDKEKQKQLLIEIMKEDERNGMYDDVSEGAAVASEGQEEANTCADAGCPRCKSSDLLDTDDHWTHCQDCGFSFVG